MSIHSLDPICHDERATICLKLLNIIRLIYCNKRTSFCRLVRLSPHCVTEPLLTWLVDAVDYMHQRGVFHRDLKDENVVIDKHLQVKLIDFGSAVWEDLNEPRTVYIDEFKGTEAYAPPRTLNPRTYVIPNRSLTLYRGLYPRLL